MRIADGRVVKTYASGCVGVVCRCYVCVFSRCDCPWYYLKVRYAVDACLSPLVFSNLSVVRTLTSPGLGIQTLRVCMFRRDLNVFLVLCARMHTEPDAPSTRRAGTVFARIGSLVNTVSGRAPFFCSYARACRTGMGFPSSRGQQRPAGRM